MKNLGYAPDEEDMSQMEEHEPEEHSASTNETAEEIR